MKAFDRDHYLEEIRVQLEGGGHIVTGRPSCIIVDGVNVTDYVSVRCVGADFPSHLHEDSPEINIGRLADVGNCRFQTYRMRKDHTLHWRGIILKIRNLLEGLEEERVHLENARRFKEQRLENEKLLAIALNNDPIISCVETETEPDSYVLKFESGSLTLLELKSFAEMLGKFREMHDFDVFVVD